MKRSVVYNVIAALPLIYILLVAAEAYAQVDARNVDASRMALLDGLQPPKRPRPVVAVIGANDGTETTDYLVPYRVLKRANIADVYALGTQPGPIKMMPALSVQPDTSSQMFDPVPIV